MENENEVPSETPEIETPEVTPETPEVKAESSPAEQADKGSPPAEEHIPLSRLNKVVWQREEALRKASRLEQELEEVKRRVQKPEAKTEADPTRPNVNDPRFTSYDEYTEALAEWKVEQRIQKAQAEYNQRVQKERFDKDRKTFEGRAEKAREKFPDFDELFERAGISEAMAPTILKSESGPELAVYLARNPDVAHKLYNLEPREAAHELGKIEAKLDDLLQPKVVTDAKPPLSPVKPKGDLPDGLDDKLSPKEWQKRRAKQLGR
jgi:hypothetical protein